MAAALAVTQVPPMPLEIGSKAGIHLEFQEGQVPTKTHFNYRTFFLIVQYENSNIAIWASVCLL
jgi:hypothetical protein